MPKVSEYELEREANIARNRALLEQLELKEAVSSLGIPHPKPAPAASNAKPVQPAKRKKLKRENDDEPVVPRRSSARLRAPLIDPNESPGKKRKREAEEEERRAKEAEEALAADERARAAKRPRHHDLDLPTLVEDAEPQDIASLTDVLRSTNIKCTGIIEDGDDEERSAGEVEELREKLRDLKVVSRAKVTQDRVYSAAYHPEVTKDLVFFGDKHGQLGIWDARAPPDEVADEDGDITAGSESQAEPGGKYWRLQTHWPATSKSSLSCIKFNPIDSHSVYTSAYDCTIRSLSFETATSREVYHALDAFISSIDLTPSGHEMWISDAVGGLTHLDLREDNSNKQKRPRWYGLSEYKIGCVSVNPREPHFLLTASNSRVLKIWDARKLKSIPVTSLSSAFDQDPTAPLEFDSETVQTFLQSKKGQGGFRGEWKHNKSVSSAYWDSAHGRRVVSTSYDDTLRLWDINTAKLGTSASATLPKPLKQLKHNCQTGQWLTILRAQWTPNRDVHPYFTIGNMDHSLDIYSCEGELVAKLADRSKITAVQAVTCSHPSVVERVATGNGTGRCVLWAPADL